MLTIPFPSTRSLNLLASRTYWPKNEIFLEEELRPALEEMTGRKGRFPQRYPHTLTKSGPLGLVAREVSTAVEPDVRARPRSGPAACRPRPTLSEGCREPRKRSWSSRPRGTSGRSAPTPTRRRRTSNVAHARSWRASTRRSRTWRASSTERSECVWFN